MNKRIIGKDAKKYLEIKSKKLENGCWEWTGYMERSGYGIEPRNYWFKQYKVSRAHQLSYKVYKGEYNKAALEISHKCHNKSCINPEHLEAKTSLENRRQDLNNKGNSKMYIEGSMQEILLEVQKGIGYEEVMKKYKISKHRLKTILSFKKYANKLGGESIWDPYKIKEKDLLKIKQLREKGKTLQSISEVIGCSESMICRILKGNRRI